MLFDVVGRVLPLVYASLMLNVIDGVSFLAPTAAHVLFISEDVADRRGIPVRVIYFIPFTVYGMPSGMYFSLCSHESAFAGEHPVRAGQ